MDFDERNALRLTLKRFLDIDELKQNIVAYDSTLVEYYETQDVKFSDGKRIPFSSADDDLIIKSLSDRVYDTRNSIVHSKESNKPKYVPFQHDRMLVKEVPLIRFSAEQIILGSSEIMGP